MLAQALADYREYLVTASKRCSVGRWGMSLSEEDKAAFDLSIKDFSISNSALFSIFRKSGADFSTETLRRHRNGDCGCQN